MAPLLAAAVRTVLIAAVSCFACSARCIHNAAAPAAITKPGTTHRKRERRGGVSTGFTGVGCATGGGAGNLICGTCIHASLPPWRVAPERQAILHLTDVILRD
jgi:hypothetical protein